MKKLPYLLLVLIASVGLFSMNACKSKSKLTSSQKRDMKEAYVALKNEIPEAKVTYEDDKVKLVFPEAVLFEPYGTTINKNYLPTFAKFAKVLNQYQETTVLITGYTDTTGGEALNEKLSWGRAEGAKQALLDNNIKTKRIYTWGFGSKSPIADNETADGRKQNRRVEFVVLYNYQDDYKK